MKKFFAILLSLALIMGLCTVAFAASESSTTVTVGGTTERTFNAYQLLDLTVSLKEGEHHPACPVDTDPAAEHLDGCYNYSYRFLQDANGNLQGNAAVYLKILQKETQAKGGNYVWGTAGEAPANYQDVTVDQILKYLSNQNEETMPSVAARIYNAIVHEGVQPDDTIASGDEETLAQGYWLFVDTTSLNGQNAANSLIVVDTKGMGALAITPKVALPTSSMSVKNIDDTEILGANIMGQPWAAVADYDIGDSIPYKMFATVPDNVLSFPAYKISFHCTMSAGLTLNDEIQLVDMGDDVQFFVKMYDNIATEEADGNMDGGTDVTDKFTLTKTGNSFTVTCDDIKAISGLKSTSVFAVYFETQLNENAEIGNPGNTIESYLEYTNNVTDAASTGQTVPAKLAVFTYQMVINKIDEQGHALKGAEFTLYKLNRNGEAVVVADTLTAAESNNGTKFIWTGLDDGDYRLEETVVPNGYNKMDPVSFTVWSEFGTNADNVPELTLLTAGETQGDNATGAITENVVNKTGSVLPETGAAGTMMLIGFGTALVVVAAVFMITRKKMSIYKD